MAEDTTWVDLCKQKARIESELQEALLAYTNIEDRLWEVDAQCMRYKARCHSLKAEEELVRVTEALESTSSMTLSNEEQFVCLIFPRDRFPLLAMLAEDIQNSDVTVDDDGDNDTRTILEHVRTLIQSHKAAVLGSCASSKVSYISSMPTRDYRRGKYVLSLDTEGPIHNATVDRTQIRARGLPYLSHRVKVRASDEMDRWAKEELPVPTVEDLFDIHVDNPTFDGRHFRMLRNVGTDTTCIVVEVTTNPKELVAVFVPMK